MTLRVRDTTRPMDQTETGLHVGQYLLTELQHQEKSTGESYARLVLDDLEGSLIAYLWAERQHLILPISLPCIVQVTGKLGGRGTGRHLSIDTLQRLPVSAIESGIRLLPKRFCPATSLGSLKQLSDWESTWPPPLRRFVAQVLLDPRIGIPFLRAKAAGRYHHAYRGGLLLHSVELLELVPPMAQGLMPDEPMAPALCQVAVLFHDLGKIYTVGEGDSQRPDLPAKLRHQSHEELTCQLLKHHLDALAVIAPEAAAVLDAVFSFLARPHQQRGHAPSLVIDIVRFIDQMSTAIDRGVGYQPQLAESQRHNRLSTR